MAMYVILSKLSPDAFQDPKEFKKLADTVASRIRKQCPNVNWRQSFVTLGRFDVVDIVESKNPDEVARAALLIRGYGHATTETLEEDCKAHNSTHLGRDYRSTQPTLSTGELANASAWPSGHTDRTDH